MPSADIVTKLALFICLAQRSQTRGARSRQPALTSVLTFAWRALRVWFRVKTVKLFNRSVRNGLNDLNGLNLLNGRSSVVSVKRAGRENFLDGEPPVGKRLLSRVIQQCLENNPVLLDRVRPGVRTEQGPLFLLFGAKPG
jgi:hypothetical protein